MSDDIKFYAFDLEAEAGASTLSNAEGHKTYIAIQCQNERCGKRKLFRPSGILVSPDDFQTLEISTIASRMRCKRCGDANPLITFFKEYAPLGIAEVPPDHDKLVSCQQLGGDSEIYEYKNSTPTSRMRRTLEGNWVVVHSGSGTSQAVMTDDEYWQTDDGFWENDTEQELIREEREELDSYSEGLASSDEDGWFYGDEN
ncbi:MAG: hypothetical protein HOL08_08000 [Opitutae bacterium]|jgi:hypothetical protein|nr:hypothetical protein [Opitutae bacterium]